MDKKIQALRIIDYIASRGHAMWEHTKNPEKIPLTYFGEKIGTICNLIEEIGGTKALKESVDDLTIEDYSSIEWTG